MILLLSDLKKGLQRFIYLNFLEPSAIAIDLRHGEREHAESLENLRQINDIRKKGKTVQLIKLQKSSKNFEQKIKEKLKNNINKLSALYAKEGSGRALYLLKSRYPTKILAPLKDIIADMEADAGACLLKDLDKGFLVNNYFGASGELSDAVLEFSLREKANGPDKDLLTQIAASLGHTDALVIIRDQGYEHCDFANCEQKQKFNKFVLYLAHMIADPEAVLVAGVETLAEEQFKDEAIALLEFFLVMPEANYDSQSTIISSKKSSSGEAKYSPHALTQHYVHNSQPDKAKEVFLQSLEKGFLPSMSLNYEIILRIRVLSEPSQLAHNLEIYANQLLSHKLPNTFHLNCILLSIYVELEDVQRAQEQLLLCLNKLMVAGDLDDIISRQLVLFDCLRLFNASESIWPKDTPCLLELIELLSKLEHIVFSEDMGSYYYALFILNDRMGNMEEREKYLELAAKSGHDYARTLFVSEVILRLKDIIFDYVKTSHDIIKAASHPLLEQVKHIVSQEKVKEAKIASPSMAINKNNSPKAETESARDRAIHKIKSFIEKWQSTHWKNSSRDELTNDFYAMVLNNDIIQAGNSSWMHGNHGRRKSKYGSRASSFEIGTLIDRAEKILSRLLET